MIVLIIRITICQDYQILKLIITYQKSKGSLQFYFERKGIQEMDVTSLNVVFLVDIKGTFGG